MKLQVSSICLQLEREVSRKGTTHLYVDRTIEKKKKERKIKKE
jgi:hypothetical protein